MNIFIIALISYLIGSISGSILMGKIKGVDIRKMGSGNAGGTNAFRTQGIFFALPVILIDIGKGFIATNYFSSITSSHDSKNIVIDELLGVFIIFLFYDLIFLFNDILTYLLIFILFRFFDIFKIFPANFFDKHYKNGFGVILDDIIAGLYTVLTLIILNAFI